MRRMGILTAGGESPSLLVTKGASVLHDNASRPGIGRRLPTFTEAIGEHAAGHIGSSTQNSGFGLRH